MRIRSMRFLVMAILLVPTYGRAQGNSCGNLRCPGAASDGLAVGTHLWCVVIRTFLCPLGA
jgi:hypothetical protein